MELCSALEPAGQDCEGLRSLTTEVCLWRPCAGEDGHARDEGRERERDEEGTGRRGEAHGEVDRTEVAVYREGAAGRGGPMAS